MYGATSRCLSEVSRNNSAAVAEAGMPLLAHPVLLHAVILVELRHRAAPTSMPPKPGGKPYP